MAKKRTGIEFMVLPSPAELAELTQEEGDLLIAALEKIIDEELNGDGDVTEGKVQ